MTDTETLWHTDQSKQEMEVLLMTGYLSHLSFDLKRIVLDTSRLLDERDSLTFGIQHMIDLVFLIPSRHKVWRWSWNSAKLIQVERFDLRTSVAIDIVKFWY